MDVQNLQNKYPGLITYLERNGYSKLYIDRLKREIQRILRQAGLKGWLSYTDVYLGYAEISKSPTYLREKRTFLGAIETFETFGLYPSRCQRHQILRESSYDLLSPEFKSVIDCYRNSEKRKKEATVYTESHNATTFLLALHQKGSSSSTSSASSVSHQ
jgi:hypothetical protein